MRLPHRSVWIPVAIAALAALAWYVCLIAPATESQRPWGNGDLYTQIYPMSFRGAAWLRSGVLPLWNPYQVAGHPFLATGIYGALYPPNVFYLVLPTAVAMETVVVVHLAVAGLLTYAYARTVFRRYDAAFVAATMFMLSGFMLREASWFPPALASATWLPLALLAIERICAGGGHHWIAALGLAIALSFLGGWPQTWLYTCFVVATYAATRVVVAAVMRQGGFFAAVGRLLVGALLAFLLMAPQALPTLELQAQGPRRAGGLTTAQQLVAPPRGWGVLFRDAVDASAGPARSMYLGIAAFVLLPLAFRSLTWRVVVLLLLATFALSVAASASGTAFAVYNAIGGRWFRGPVRILYIYAFAGALLTAFGFATLARASEERRDGWLVVVVSASVLVVSGMIGLPFITRIYLAVGVILTISSVLMPSRALRQVALCSLIVFIACDLVSAVQNPHLRPSQETEPIDRYAAAFDYLRQRQDGYRTYVKGLFEETPMMSKQGTLREIYSITDYEPLSQDRYSRFFERVEPVALRRAAAMTFTGSLRADVLVPQFKFLEIMSLRYIVAYKAAQRDMFALTQRNPLWHRVFISNDLDILLYEHRNPVPRAYVSPRWTTVESEDDALAGVTDLAFNPRINTIVERDSNTLTSAPGTRNKAIVPATIAEYAPDRVVVHSNATEGGYLVLTDTFYPGWQATLDGRPVPIIRANYLFRAVYVEPGPHHVTFTYRPQSVRRGAALGILGLAMIAILVGVAVRSQRRSVAAGSRLKEQRSSPRLF